MRVAPLVNSQHLYLCLLRHRRLRGGDSFLKALSHGKVCLYGACVLVEHLAHIDHGIALVHVIAAEKLSRFPCGKPFCIALVDDECIVHCLVVQRIGDGVPVIIYFNYIIVLSDEFRKCAALGSVVLVEYAYLQPVHLKLVVLGGLAGDKCGYCKEYDYVYHG